MEEQVLVVPIEIVGVKKEKNAATGLVADATFLLCANGFGQQQATPVVSAFGPDKYPTLGIAEPRIFNKIEMELIGVELDGFIVVSDYQCNVSEVRHHLCFCCCIMVSGSGLERAAASLKLPTAYRQLHTADRRLKSPPFLLPDTRMIPFFALGKLDDSASDVHNGNKYQITEAEHHKYPAVGAGLADGKR